MGTKGPGDPPSDDDSIQAVWGDPGDREVLEVTTAQELRYKFWWDIREEERVQWVEEVAPTEPAQPCIDQSTMVGNECNNVCKCSLRSLAQLFTCLDSLACCVRCCCCLLNVHVLLRIVNMWPGWTKCIHLPSFHSMSSTSSSSSSMSPSKPCRVGSRIPSCALSLAQTGLAQWQTTGLARS